jgi:SAM-dependent methyltransferase
MSKATPTDGFKKHWESIYETRALTEVSWYQATPALSHELIRATGVTDAAPIIDVGGGASLLVDVLQQAGFRDLTVLDISAAALERVRERLGLRASAITLIDADVTEYQPSRQFVVWHDRAVFHFLTDATERDRYKATLRRALTPGGHVIIATFALDGPLRCSGLEVVRYNASSLTEELGKGFALVESREEEHVTPSGKRQAFLYCRFRTDASLWSES